MRRSISRAQQTALLMMGAFAICLYVTAMFVVPMVQYWGLVVDAGFSAFWYEIQAIWDRWQAFNVGMIAFISSILIVEVSTRRARERHEAESLAARVYLSQTLSEMCVYFEACSTFLQTAFQSASRGDESEISGSPAPTPPGEHRRDFSDCIRFASPSYGGRLALVLSKMQVLDSRLRSLALEIRLSPSARINIMNEIYGVAELRALTNRLFDYARLSEQSSLAPITPDEMNTAYRSNRIIVENYVIQLARGETTLSLADTTLRRLARGAPEKL